MPRKFLQLLPLFLLFALAPAYAETCDKSIPLADIAECSDRQAANAEQELNATYAKAIAGLKAVDAEYLKLYRDRPQLHATQRLIKAQRSWLAYRSHSCSLEGLLVRSGNPNRGGPEAIAISGCNATMATNRAAELSKLIEAYNVSLATSLTGRSTRTPLQAMPSAFSWPVAVPSALRAPAPVN